ncbi:MAG: polysaccharide deacetylase family protein [Bacteroidota bacterium]|nr:polysaccharide deacetylase family protein [Bacteroidota bacterium]
MYKFKCCFLFVALIATNILKSQTVTPTYAEKLGFPKGSKVLIIHVDDAGMSHDSNEGTIEAITKGAATSTSVMMPCSWVPEFVHFLKQHPGIDAGLHLTLTSEWKDYRWGPISGKSVTPSLVDKEGDLWRSVAEVVQYASADDVEKEIRAQLDRARTMGFEPTHLDSHMGTLFASPEFLKRYIKVGIENHIPVMLPGGNDVLIQEEEHFSDIVIKQLQSLGNTLWNAGLPVLDDLHNFSYGWKIPENIANDDDKLRDFKTEKYIAALKLLQPGVTMMIMHCTDPSETFKYISDSGPLRKSDLLAMLNPKFKQALKDNGIIVTTWRELMERRKKVK